MIKTGDRVLIRTQGAGVHFGTLVSQKGQEVHLSNCRRLWKWEGANTDNNRPGSLSEVATGHINLKESKISDAVEEIILPTAIEIIKVSEGSSLPI